MKKPKTGTYFGDSSFSASGDFNRPTKLDTDEEIEFILESLLITVKNTYLPKDLAVQQATHQINALIRAGKVELLEELATAEHPYKAPIDKIYDKLIELRGESSKWLFTGAGNVPNFLLRGLGGGCTIKEKDARNEA